MDFGQRKPGSEDGVQEVGEWLMVDADVRGHAVTGLGGNRAPARLRVPGQNDRNNPVDVGGTPACDKR